MDIFTSLGETERKGRGLFSYRGFSLRKNLLRIAQI
jgi:hypothetical protein